MSQTEDIPVVEEQVKEVDHPEDEVQPEQVEQEEIPTKDESHDQETPKPKPKPKKKSVGFAPPPEEDLKEHHQVIKEKEAERAKSHPFHKIPPELAYLEKRDHKLDPKPLGKPAPAAVTSKPYSMPPLKTLKYIDIKALGVVNKATELQFHYSGIELPPAAGSMVVDVKYGGLNNLDIAKLNQYVLNLSDVKVGIGYEFSGIVSQVGAGVSFVPGDIVYGLISPDARRGALSTNQIIYPNRDVVIKVDKETLNKLNDVNIKICFDDNKSFQVEDDDGAAEEEEEQVGQQSTDLDSLWKLAAFPTVVNRAEQLIRHLKPKNGRANVLINGGDTNVGLTITQLLFAEYNLENLNLILIIRESSQKFMDQFVTHIQEKFKDPATTKRITCIPFDLVNDDLYFPGEKIPINYKKPDFFAAEVINALLYEPVDQTNINDYKLDILIDLIGCKKFFQYTKTKLNEISTIRFPFQENIQNSSLEKLFNGKRLILLLNVNGVNEDWI
ncbi:hypothetical protein G210_4927 [Candida maltosa Xu316]|uniref:Alcohol dehydrogenase-like N-terminal domain-containing protein n=1 Tax=Candida maltosa (strain Xu316) TaxID=1245528 RepID=M3ITZ8_CANMX|nr:hypothetical protein G210_4927 [Candida maltosa Xu316]